MDSAVMTQAELDVAAIFKEREEGGAAEKRDDMGGLSHETLCKFTRTSFNLALAEAVKTE